MKGPPRVGDDGSRRTRAMGETKEARLAAALRENLKRRRAQARERRAHGTGGDAPAPEPEAPTNETPANETPANAEAHTNEKAAP